MGLKVTGIQPLLNGVSPARAIDAEREVDTELGRMAMGIGRNAGDRAPVLTGYLSRTLRDSDVKVGHLHYQVVTDVYGVIPYLWRQNFEHASKRYFFTTAFNEMEAAFPERLNSAVGRAWR